MTDTESRQGHGSSSQLDLIFAIGIFALGFLLRFAVARWLAGEPVWDGHYYDFGARRIAEGHGYSDDRTVGGRVEWHPWCHYPVGYSGYLAFFYWIFGAKAWVLHAANALVGGLTAVVTFLLAREAFPATLSEKKIDRAHIAGAFVALHPGLVLYGALAMGEILSALTIMTSFWIAIAGTRRFGPLRGVAAAAVALGIGALVRPQALLCAPFLALAIPDLFRKRLLRVGLSAALVACVVALVPVLPWTARNCRVMDGCALVSTNAGWNLAIGSFPRATGRFETLRSSDGCREVTGQVQQDRCWFQYGIDNIKARPGFWLGLIPAKLSNTFDHESFAVEYLREARPAEWPEERRVAWRTVITTLHRVLILLAPFAFLTMVLPSRRRKSIAGKRAPIIQGALFVATALAGYFAISAGTPTFWPIVIATCVLAFLPLPGRPAPLPSLMLAIVLIATTAITHAIFFGDDRYHMVITPALCLLAASMFRESAPVARSATTDASSAHSA